MSHHRKNSYFLSLKRNYSYSKDVLGILIQDHGVDTTSVGTIFRDILLTDDTKEQIMVTLWNTNAENFKCEKFDVIIVKNGTIIEYQGSKKLNCLSGSLVWRLGGFNFEFRTNILFFLIIFYILKCNSKEIVPADTLANWFKNEISDVPSSNL